MICLTCHHYIHPDGELERAQNSAHCRCACHRQPAAQPALVRTPAALPWLCPYCGRIMSNREWKEQGACNDCTDGSGR